MSTTFDDLTYKFLRLLASVAIKGENLILLYAEIKVPLFPKRTILD